MAEKWWHRLFSLDDGEEEDSGNGHDRAYAGDGREPHSVGRFEDSHRHIEVKMASRYPEGYKKAPAEDGHEPLRRDSDVPGVLDKNRADRSVSAGTARQENGNAKEKKAPFRLTKVPSPVFGYKKPPASFYGKKADEDFYLDTSKEEQEKRQIAEKKKNEAMHQRIPLPSLKTPPVIDRKVIEEPALHRRADTSAVSEDRNGKKRDEHPDEPSDYLSARAHTVAPGKPGETLRPVPEADGSVPHGLPAAAAPVSVSSGLPEAAAATRETAVPPRTMPVNSSLPRSPHRPHHQSKVPFNVLMFQSDHHTHRRPVENGERQGNQAGESGLQLPLDLLDDPQESGEESEEWIAGKERILAETLSNFRVEADILGHVRGPSVTRVDIHLHPGVKINKVLGLAEDIKLSLAVKQIRIAPVPGRSAVGIEIPNDRRKPVLLKQIMNSDAFLKSKAPLTAALGQDVSGNCIVTDLSKMPHGLIAGATGSGKSVCIHSLILSLIYKTSPDALRFLLIDPKVVELAPYQKIPHLAAPVITEPKEAALALKWAVEEMEKRYRLFAKTGVRDIAGYNGSRPAGEDQSGKLPYIVIVIDELADLMMASPQDVEESVCRIAQKARAAGIHLLLATQRPSVDVITGLIKSNIPTRIAFSVASQADSRTILDCGGAERLLGRGDMLFAENGARTIRRLQGCFVSDEEIRRVTDAFGHRPAAEYLFDAESFADADSEADGREDDLFNNAAAFVVEQGQASVSSIQRHFRIGYNRAARLVDQLESRNVVSGANGSKPRQVLISKKKFEEQISGDKSY
ncbi:DNA translocase FtsK [Sporolactobacillus sp. CQH2019]|uniref:DNA translocase FtsK n=1 Tax=Sporolactobacillus sp. CQH2019 TaxID=3023512 RepID=UPI0023680572|nr:DNA translocase FtsK [Sporolactobacillus sp. CQH2019]MDD9149490.1 DNA translocase FtsK [Sporolactobacillus sp. CQH2019]